MEVNLICKLLYRIITIIPTIILVPVSLPSLLNLESTLNLTMLCLIVGFPTGHHQIRFRHLKSDYALELILSWNSPAL